MTELSLFTLIAEDFTTHERDFFRPGFHALVVYRYGNWRMKIKFKILRAPFSLLYRILFLFIRNIYGIELSYAVKVGRRLKIEHQHGIVIHGNSVIGDDCILRHGVTLGIRDELTPTEAPTLGNKVSVGAGAKILGNIRLGDDVKIGANAVVLIDVPDGKKAMGIPAKVYE